MKFIFLLVMFVVISSFAIYMLIYIKDMILSKKFFDENPNYDFNTDYGVAIDEEGEIVLQKKPVIIS